MKVTEGPREIMQHGTGTAWQAKAVEMRNIAYDRAQKRRTHHPTAANNLVSHSAMQQPARMSTRAMIFGCFEKLPHRPPCMWRILVPRPARLQSRLFEMRSGSAADDSSVELCRCFLWLYRLPR
jgi:hypothetical protein